MQKLEHEADTIERLRRVVTAAQTWAGEKVVGDPQADKRLADAITEYERGEQ